MSKSESVKVETEELSAAVRSVTVEVGAVRVKEAFDRSYRELAKAASVKGFRKGKVPRAMMQKMYGSSVAEELERQLVSETFVDAMESAGLMPLCEPDVEADTPVEGSPFRYTARVEVRPEIELPDLEALTGKRPKVDVTDEDVETQLEQLRERHSQLVEEPEGTAAEMSSVLKIDYVGRVDGETFEGGSAQDTELELGSNRLIPGFEEQLVGAVAGDDREVKVTFPDEYVDHLKGKDAVFQVHVAEVRRRVTPDLDDEFARDMGEFETLDGLRDRIRQDMMNGRLEGAQSALRQSVMESLLEKTDFEVPPGVIERELHSQMNAMQQRYRGQVPEDLLRSQISRMHEEGRPGAEQKVRESFLLARITESESLEVGDEEVDARLDEMAEAQGMESGVIRKMAAEQGWRDAIRGELVEKLALDFLVSKATVEEVEETSDAESEGDS